MSRNKLVLTGATSTVPRMLSTAEVAVILNVSRRIVLDWIATGDLPAFRIGPQTRVIRVRESDLETFIEKNIRAMAGPTEVLVQENR